ncbi:MAG: iron uptake porin [Leptolyngbyaceae bacterium]|nr:iron uptake porin [Leptolyngbyaceae bacterium]
MGRSPFEDRLDNRWIDERRIDERWIDKRWIGIGASVVMACLMMSALTRRAIALPSASPNASDLPSSPQASSPSSPTPTQRPPLASSPWDTVPAVHQLRDIEPIDWEYLTLASIIETYELVLDENSPLGNQEPLTRYEFVATLEAAIAQIEQRVESEKMLVNQGDYRALARLVEQFAINISSLSLRLTEQETRTLDLEIGRFSPLARLNGEVVLSLTDQLGNDRTAVTTLQQRSRLAINASFTGRDRFQTQLVMGGTPSFLDADEAGDRPTDTTGEGTLVTSIGGDTDDQIELERVVYTFPLGDRISGYVSATGGRHHHYVHTTVNPQFDDGTGGNGSLSAFSQFSPIYSIGGGAGLGMDARFGDGDTRFAQMNQRLAVSLGYLADQAADPTSGSGVFNGDYALLGQVSFVPSHRFHLGATYVRGYHSRGEAIFDFDGDENVFIGSGFANQTHTQLGTSATTNSFGLQTSYRINRSLTLNAFAGYTDITFQNVGSGDIWYYGLNLAFPDLVLPNSIAGVTIGVEPYLGGVEGASIEIPNATSLHLEVFYKLQLTTEVSLTPGIIWVTEPNQGDRPGFVIGTLRTTFRF